MECITLYITCFLFLLPSVVTAAEDLKPEMITTENNDYFGYLDEFKGFQCQAKGTNLKYSWKHNDITIDASYILKFPDTNSSTLKPLQDNIDESYNGFYQCFVTNSIGTIFGRRTTVEFTIVGEFLLSHKTTPKTLTAAVGKSFKLDCPKHEKSHNTKYNWYYKQADTPQPLPSSNNYFVTKDGELYFSVLRKEDIKFVNDNGGIYCYQYANPENSNIRATESQIIKLEEGGSGSGTFIEKKPEIKTTISDQTIFIGQTKPLVLRCGATGYPIPTLKWYRIDPVSSAETEIKGDSDFRLLRYNQLLSIGNVGPDKAGQYKCVAKNSKGKDEISASVTVAEYPQWMSEGELQDINPPLYDSVKWRCAAFGGPSYHWYKNGVEITEASTQNSPSYLVIKNVTTAHNGMYQCTASNEREVIYSAGRLQVKEMKPRFTEQMGPVILIMNRTGIVICPVIASPSPRITWRKNGHSILKVGRKDPNNDKRLRVSKNGRDLLIPDVKETDAGTYTCYAENKKGHAESHSIATVGKDIEWVNAPISNRNVTVTLRFELDCEASGDESYEINYRWLRNGLPLELSARIHWVKEAHRLVILDAIVSDTGLYTCIASAETPLYIEKRKDADVVVKAPADPPDIVRVSGDCWKKKADLVWQVGALNNEEIYEYWIDWASTYDPTNWTRLPKVLEEDPKPVALDFNLLPPFSQISFRVTVFNRIGAGVPSVPTDPSDCITPPSAPRHSPSSIKGIPGGPNTLRLEWTPVPQTFWGAPAFNYSVQWRRKGGDTGPNRWRFLPLSQDIRIYDGNNNSLTVTNPGYYVEWEFRIRSNNAKGSAPYWTTGSSFSGQDAPDAEPTGLTPDRATARSADISWQRVSAPKNGSIEGYKVQYWHSSIGMAVAYDKNANNSHIDLATIEELEIKPEDQSRKKREVSNLPREVVKRSADKPTADKPTADKPNVAGPLTKRDIKTSIVARYLKNKGHQVSKRDTKAQNVPRSRTKREDEDEDVEKEDPLDLCFNPDEPCYQNAAERESQLTDLTPYKTYHVRIAAYNSGGLGPWSKELIFNTAEGPPGAPYAVLTFPYDKFCKLTWKEPRHKNGKILEYEIYGRNIIRTKVPWWMRRHIIYDLKPAHMYEAKIKARTSSGWGSPVFRWFQTHENAELPAKPLAPEVVGYGEDGVNVTFMEPKPIFLRKYGGGSDMDEDPWEFRPVGGHEMEQQGVGGYPAKFYVLYRRRNTKEKPLKTLMKQMWGPRDQTWIVIEKLHPDTVYEFATVPVNDMGEGPQSDWSVGLTGGIVPRVEKLYWYQRDWFVALIVVFFAALLLLGIIVVSTMHLKSIYYEGAPKRRKDRERERIYEPEDVDGGFNEFTLKSARSSRSVVTSRSEAPPPYNSIVGGSSRHSGDFDDDEDDTDSDDEKHEVSTYYSDEKKVPLDDDFDDDDDEGNGLATFV